MYRLVGFSREDCVIDHLILLQARQKAAGLPVTPDSHGGGHRRGAAAEAAAKEAKEKAKAKAEAKAAAEAKEAPAKEVKE